MMLLAVFLPTANLAAAEQVALQLKWKHQFQFAGFYMALEKGIYKDAGFDVAIRELPLGKSAVQLLVDGQTDYAVVDTGALLSYAEGVPIMVLAAIYQHSPLALMVINPDIRTINDLHGKRIMMAPGLNADIIAALGKAGIGSGDFIRQDISFDVRDLIDGKTDAFTVYVTDQTRQLETLGVPYRLFRPKKQGIDFYGDILVTTDTILKEKPEQAMAFTRASMRGWNYALAHIDETLDVIEKKFNPQHLSRSQLRFEALKTKEEMILGDVVDLGYMSDKRWNHIAGVYQSLGLLPAGFDVSGFVYHDEPGFMDMLSKYRWELGMMVLLLSSLFLAFYNIRLRHVVSARTRVLNELNRELEKLTLLDGLTCVGNRRMFEQAFSSEWHRALRNEYSLSLLLIDIDYFKLYNDLYGHQQGDVSLRQVASTLVGVCKRAEDTVVRYGGEEFVALLPGTDMEQASILAEKCRQAVLDLQLPHERSAVSEVVSVSIGVSSVLPVTDIEAMSLLESADMALYRAKAKGRNRVEQAT